LLIRAPRKILGRFQHLARGGTRRNSSANAAIAETAEPWLQPLDTRDA
jgi:hypothetical protein